MIASDPVGPAPTTPQRLLALPLSSSAVEMEQHDDVDTNESSDFESNPDDDRNTSQPIDVSLLGHKLERVLSTIEEQVEEKRIHQTRANTSSDVGDTADLIQLNSDGITDELEPYFEDDNTNAGDETTLDHSESSLLDDGDSNAAFGDTLLEPSHLHDDDTPEHHDKDLTSSTEHNVDYDHADLLYSGHGARRVSLELQVDFADGEAEHDDASDDSTDTAKAGNSYLRVTDVANNETMIESGNTEHDDQESVLQNSTHERNTQHLHEHMHADLNQEENASKFERSRIDSTYATGRLTPESHLITPDAVPDIQHPSNHVHLHDNNKLKEADLPDPTTPKDNGLPESHTVNVPLSASTSVEERPANMSWIMTTPPRSGQKSDSVEDSAPENSPSAQIRSVIDVKDHDTGHGSGKTGEGTAVHTNSKTSAAVVEDEAHTTSDAVVGSSTSVFDIMKSYNLNQNKSDLPFVRFEPFQSSEDLAQLVKDSEHSGSGQALPSGTMRDINHPAKALPGPAAWWVRTLVAAWTPSADVLNVGSDSHIQPAMTARKANLRSPTSASLRRAAKNIRNQRKHGRPARSPEVSPEQMATSSKWIKFSSDVEAHDTEMFLTSQRAIEARRAEFAQNDGEYRPVFNEIYKKTVPGEKLGDRRVVAVTKSVHSVHGASEDGLHDADTPSSFEHAPILLPPVRAPVLPDQEYDPWPAGLEEEVLRRVASLSPARSARATTPDRPITLDPSGKSSDKENKAPLLAGSSSSRRTATSSGPSSPVSPSPSSFRGRRFATPIALKLSQAVLSSESGTPPVTGASDDTVPMDSPSLSAGILLATDDDEQTPLLGDTTRSATSDNEAERLSTTKSASSTLTSLLSIILSFLSQGIVALFGFWTTLGEKMDNAFLRLKDLFSGEAGTSDEERVSAITTAFTRFSVVGDEDADEGRSTTDEEDRDGSDTLWIRKPRTRCAGQQDGGATARDVEENVMEGDVLEEQEEEEEEPGEEWWI